MFTMDSRDTVMQQLPFQFYPEVNQVRWPLFKRAMEEALVGLCQKLDVYAFASSTGLCSAVQ